MNPEKTAAALLRHSPVIVLDAGAVSCSCDHTFRSRVQHATHVARALAVAQAAQDPEGRALVQAIHDRKAARQ